ncbi:MAG: hypothetical protein ACI8XB_000575 [Patiriisocius sp.]|jgi:hypothetical protein
MTTPTSHIKFELDTTLNEILERCLKYSSLNPGINNSAISDIVNDATKLKSEISNLIFETERKKDKEKLGSSLQFIQNELGKKSEHLRSRIAGLSRLV